MITDFTPAGTAQALVEAEDPVDVAIALASSNPISKCTLEILKKARGLYKQGKVKEADDLLAEAGRRGPKATASFEKEAGTYFGQQRKYWSQEPIQYNGNKVYQRNDLIDPGRVDSRTGLTNKQLMENGLASYGTNGKKINLHHMLQTQDGPIAEVTQSFHQKNAAVIHISSGSDISSGINRVQFEKWKKGYWKARVSNF